MGRHNPVQVMFALIYKMARHPLNTSDIEVTLTKIARLILDDLKVSKKEMDIDNDCETLSAI